MATGDLWLKDPIQKLHEKIRQSMGKARTRSMAEDLRIGDDIQMASSNIPALEVINESDNDIELISYGIAQYDPCKLWHLARISKNGILSRSILPLFYCSDHNDHPHP